jgi:hypothetical protein
MDGVASTIKRRGNLTLAIPSITILRDGQLNGFALDFANNNFKTLRDGQLNGFALDFARKCPIFQVLRAVRPVSG